MLIDIDCPNCGRHYRLNDTLRGKKVKCKECEEPFKVPAAEEDDFLDDLDDADEEEEDEDFAPVRRRSSSSPKSSSKSKSKSKKRKSSGEGFLASTWDWMRSLAPSDQLLIWWVLISIPFCLIAPVSRDTAFVCMMITFVGFAVASLYGVGMQLYALFQQEDVVLIIVLHFIPGINAITGIYLLVARWEWFGPPFIHNLKTIGIFLVFFTYFVLLGPLVFQA